MASLNLNTRKSKRIVLILLINKEIRNFPEMKLIENCFYRVPFVEVLFVLEVDTTRIEGGREREKKKVTDKE